MAISSTSSITDVKAEYVDNADYDAQASATTGLAMARAFVKACRVLLLKMPKQGGQDRGSLSLNPELVQKQLDQAVRYIQATPDVDGTGGTGGVRHFDLSNYRGEGGVVE